MLFFTKKTSFIPSHIGSVVRKDEIYLPRAQMMKVTTLNPIIVLRTWKHTSRYEGNGSRMSAFMFYIDKK